VLDDLYLSEESALEPPFARYDGLQVGSVLD
jgi:hypothetical protein